MNISLFIARKLRIKGGTRKSSSSSSIIAVAGIAIAIFVMVLTLTVVLGFKNQIREKVTGFDSQISILPPIVVNDSSDLSITYDEKLLNLISSIVNLNNSNASIALALKQPGIMKTDDNFAGLIFKGVSDISHFDFVKQNLIAGEIPNFENDSCKNKVVISSTTANALNIALGDKINTYFFTDNNIRARKFEIAGIYNSNFSEYDKLLAFAPLSTLQRIALLDSLSGSSIEIRGINHDEIAPLSLQLQSAIHQSVYNNDIDKLYSINNVLQSGAMYFNWLALLDTNVVVILILMSCVAGFTLISCLFIIILERVKTIGLLKALGATNAQVRQIFRHMAQRLVLRGMIIGNILSLSFVFLQEKYHLIALNPEAYYLSYVPVEINWWHILILNVCVIIVSSAILILPSHLASTISPAQTMRYE